MNVTRFVIDILAMFGACILAAPMGLTGQIAAMLVTAAYGAWCFYDGCSSPRRRS